LKVGHPSGARNAQLDRICTWGVMNYSGDGLAPHAPTLRWSYTVPTGVRAILESLFCLCYRWSAPTTSSMVFCYIWVGSAVLAFAMFEDPAQFAQDKDCQGFSMHLDEGETVTGYTGDMSTDGSCCFKVTSRYVEYRP